MGVKRLHIMWVMLLMAIGVMAQVPLTERDYSGKTCIAPGYFGPNAFQVPEMLEGVGSDKLNIELACDFIYGRLGAKDNTHDIAVKVNIPLFTERVNLSLWWSVYEWYSMSEDVMEYRRIAHGKNGKGHGVGTLYISTDILALKEGKWWPSIVLRAALRTASEDGAYTMARSYDAAGYFFDVAFGKNFGPVRVSLSTGFLCWQTNVGRQNDAVMFGAKVSYAHQYFSLSAHYGGYVGWERSGDCPTSLRIRGDFGPERWPVTPFVEYQHGFTDWPFCQSRIGLRSRVDILNMKKKKEIGGANIE